MPFSTRMFAVLIPMSYCELAKLLFPFLSKYLWPKYQDNCFPLPFLDQNFFSWLPPKTYLLQLASCFILVFVWVFWPRAMLKGPKRSFVAVFSCSWRGIMFKKRYNGNKKCLRTKFVPNETKNVIKRTKNVCYVDSRNGLTKSRSGQIVSCSKIASREIFSKWVFTTRKAISFISNSTSDWGRAFCFVDENQKCILEILRVAPWWRYKLAIHYNEYPINFLTLRLTRLHTLLQL